MAAGCLAAWVRWRSLAAGGPVAEENIGEPPPVAKPADYFLIGKAEAGTGWGKADDGDFGPEGEDEVWMDGGKPDFEAGEDWADSVVMPADGLAWEAPPVSDETIAFVRNAFAQWRSSQGDEEAKASLRLSLAGRMSKPEMLAAAAMLMRLGTAQDRMDAMLLVECEFFSPYDEVETIRVNVPDSGDGDEPEADAETLAEEEREAQETHDVVALVSAGFEDADSRVRQAAYEAAMELSRERNNILLGQLLCSDSPRSAGLRRQLMDELDGAADDEAVTLFVSAVQSPDEATAAAAKKNLEAIAGRTFGDVTEVADWLEERENADAETEEEPDGRTGDEEFEEDNPNEENT